MKSSYEISTTYDVFISYRRSSGICQAKLLEKYFTDMGLSVFRDLNISESGKYPEILSRTLRSSKNFVLLITPKIFDNCIRGGKDWVAEEIRMALRLCEEGKIKILPYCMVHGTPVPAATSLPEDIRGIMDFQINETDIAKKEEDFKKDLREFSEKFNLIPDTGNNYTKIGPGDEMGYAQLRKQIDNSIHFDKEHVNYVLKKLKESGVEEIRVLDVGCEWGYSGRLLFDKKPFSIILGIDKDKKCIDEASLLPTNGRFVYGKIDLEDSKFEDHLDKMMRDNKVEKFDLIYASMVLHQLSVPSKTLRDLYKKLNKGGYIIVKGSDDGSKIISKDSSESTQKNKEKLDEIIKMTKNIPSMSDREFGRKIYGLLNRTGFEEIEIFFNNRETSRMSLEEKESLFKETFDWRLNACYIKNDEGIIVPFSGRVLKNMKEAIEYFEEVFMSDEFWYCDHDYVGIAKK